MARLIELIFEHPIATFFFLAAFFGGIAEIIKAVR